MKEKRIFTSESVTEGHPDKVCDAVSDAILDAMLAQDPMSRVACETCVTTDFVLIMGEVTSRAKVDIEQVVRDTIAEIGYTVPGLGFDAESCQLDIRLGTQSPDIALGVDRSLESKADGGAETGAGDQGMMYGYAANETDNYMPFPIDLAHALTRQLATVRKSGVLPWLRPDGKSQVSIEYDEDGRPFRIDTVVLSTQHDETVTQEQLAREVRAHVINPILPAGMVDARTRILINPTGRFVVGGPHGDSGLTGRKIIVDSYGGYARHGGGAFSGKDPTKVDRSASYMARYAAKNLVAAGLARRCEVQLSYAIGVATPTSVAVDTFGTGRLPDAELSAIVRRHFDLRPAGIIDALDLRRPIYRATAAYGHFGRDDLDLPWERLDKVAALKPYLT